MLESVDLDTTPSATIHIQTVSTFLSPHLGLVQGFRDTTGLLLQYFDNCLPTSPRRTIQQRQRPVTSFWPRARAEKWKGFHRDRVRHYRWRWSWWEFGRSGRRHDQIAFDGELLVLGLSPAVLPARTGPLGAPAQQPGTCRTWGRTGISDGVLF